MEAAEWLKAFATELGREETGAEAPSPGTVDVLLEMAGVAAHASERIAAPIACYMVGVAGIDAEQALAAARRVGPTSA
ncbi:MAG: DUF6457 domain-containing protein [Microthrixaceae bacterium]|nr:DUF6457 domain-containing protein [Microthrixaceae bacterium]